MGPLRAYLIKRSMEIGSIVEERVNGSQAGVTAPYASNADKVDNIDSASMLVYRGSINNGVISRNKIPFFGQSGMSRIYLFRSIPLSFIYLPSMVEIKVIIIKGRVCDAHSTIVYC